MNIDLLLHQLVVPPVSYGALNFADSDTAIAPADQPWLLLASVAMCAISFFLLYQAAGFQEWVTANDKRAPNPRAGVGLAWALGLVMVLFSALYWIFHHPPPANVVNGRADVVDVVSWFISSRPSGLAPGPLLGSIVPAAMAIFKFLMAGFIMRGAGQEVPSLSRSPTAALAGAMFALISLAASIATLIMFFVWSKNP